MKLTYDLRPTTYDRRGKLRKILENNKDTLRKHIKDLEISLPRQVVSSKSARVVFEKFGSPWVVKSFSDGSNSLAVHLAHTFNELVARIEDGLKQGKSILFFSPSYCFT